MHIQFLGTGAGVPAKSRNVSSLVLKLLDEINEVWMFDCGEGTQQQILETTIRPRKITNIFITHLHGDHMFGLPGFLSSRSFQGGENDPLTVYGPKGIKDFIHTSLRVSRSRLSYPLNIVELDPKGGVIEKSNGWIIRYLPLDHGILSFGYRVEEPDAVGELQMDKLTTYQIPNGPIFGKLKNKETVELEDGTVLCGEDFVGEDRPGRIVTVLGDTRKCANIATLAKDANVLVHESTFSKKETKMAHDYFHSTNVQAAQVAKAQGVRQLYLTHISARYLGKMAKQLEAEARAVFPNTRLVFDFDEFKI